MLQEESYSVELRGGRHKAKDKKGVWTWSSPAHWQGELSVTFTHLSRLHHRGDL